MQAGRANAVPRGLDLESRGKGGGGQAITRIPQSPHPTLPQARREPVEKLQAPQQVQIPQLRVENFRPRRPSELTAQCAGPGRTCARLVR